jgi:hypothetical protein
MRAWWCVNGLCNGLGVKRGDERSVKQHVTCGVDATDYTDWWNPHAMKWSW